MTYAPAARRRRRRRTIIGLVITGVVALTAYGVTKAQGEAEVTRAYLDVAYRVATEASASAESFNQMIEGIEEFTRPRMLQTLESIEAEADVLASLLAEGNPPGSLERADDWLQIASTAWRSGLSDARAGLIALSSNPLDEEGAQSLSRGLVDLRVGDRAYRGFLSEVGDVDTTLLGGPFPQFSFVPSSTEELFDPQELARRMFLSPDLALVDDIAVADIRLEPAPVGTSQGLPVVPVSAEQSLEATITNRGNEGRTDIAVSLRMVSNDGEEYAATAGIDSLPGGSAVAVAFTELPVQPGTIYQVLVSIPGGDDESENDSLEFLFAVNEDS